MAYTLWPRKTSKTQVDPNHEPLGDFFHCKVFDAQFRLTVCNFCLTKVVTVSQVFENLPDVALHAKFSFNYSFCGERELFLFLVYIMQAISRLQERNQCRFTGDFQRCCGGGVSIFSGAKHFKQTLHPPYRPLFCSIARSFAGFCLFVFTSS